jgi:spermidine synthase
MKNRIHKTILILMMCITSLGFAATASNPLGKVVHQKNSLYNGIFVYKNGAIISLKFGKRATSNIQSQVDSNDPQRHMLEYSRMTFCGLLYKPEPKKMLVLGLGGGVIPRQMRHYFPSLEIDVAEIDPDIPPIATQFMGFKEDEKLKVYVDDGRMFIKKQLRRNPVPKYDMIVLDAFNGDYIPFHLMTKEFLQEVKGVLADDGVVIANVFYTNRLFDAEFKTFISVFGRSQAFFGAASGNAMLVSPGPACPILTQQEAVEHARQIQPLHTLSFDLVEIAELLRPDAHPDSKAKVLTDDLAPVNWLREQETNKTPDKIP